MRALVTRERKRHMNIDPTTLLGAPEHHKAVIRAPEPPAKAALGAQEPHPEDAPGAPTPFEEGALSVLEPAAEPTLGAANPSANAGLAAPSTATLAPPDSLASSTSEPLPSTCLDTNLSYLELSRPISTEKFFPLGTRPGSTKSLWYPLAASKPCAKASPRPESIFPAPQNPQLSAVNRADPQLNAANRSSRFFGAPGPSTLGFLPLVLPGQNHLPSTKNSQPSTAGGPRPYASSTKFDLSSTKFD